MVYPLDAHGRWWAGLLEHEKKKHLYCAILELDGQRHELQEQLDRSCVMRNALGKQSDRYEARVRELEDENAPTFKRQRDAAIQRAAEAEARATVMDEENAVWNELQRDTQDKLFAAEADRDAWRRRAEHAEAARNLAELDATERLARVQEIATAWAQTPPEIRREIARMRPRLADVLAGDTAPTETRDEWHARRCPAKSSGWCNMAHRWDGSHPRYDYGPAREFVGRTCAGVYEAEQGRR